MGARTDIEYRMKLLQKEDNKLKLNALERSRKIKSIEVTEGKINTRLWALNSMKEDIEKEIVEMNNNLVALKAEKGQIDTLKSPVVTEHALLRYVERYMGVDLTEVHEKILALPEADKIKAKNTVITVFPDKEDNFNLAEREKQ